MTTTIDALSDKEVGTGAAAELIRAAEQVLGVQFPKDYITFLRKYGWARLMYDEMYGVGESVPDHLNLITNTVRERTDFRPFMPKYLVPVLGDGAGNHFCLDLSKVGSESCPVVFWDHDEVESQSPKTVGPSFSDWIVEYVIEQI